MNSELRNIIEQLRAFDWRFVDYNPSLERFSINNVHWYPAPFVPHIPSILIKSLSKPGDIVLDPFCGTGITGIEAARLNRRFVQLDLNPLAIEIAQAKLTAIRIVDDTFTERIINSLNIGVVNNKDSIAPDSIQAEEAGKWFHPETLSQLLILKNIAQNQPDEATRLVTRFLLSSILYAASSQTKHYSYVTDNCYPNQLIERNAVEFFLERLLLLRKAVNDFRINCNMNSTIPQLVSYGVTEMGDARNLSMLPRESVDIVVTSPPYIGVNDYVKSQRLTYLLFPPFPSTADSAEIGTRQKRRRKTAVTDYLCAMKMCIDEMIRITKNDGFICIALGQSSSIKGTDIVEELVIYTSQLLGNVPVLDIVRPIVFRKIYNTGIGSERLLVFHKG